MTLSDALVLADLALRFGRVDRVTRHPDGRRLESDTDHTVMLGLVACAFAERHPGLGLDIGLVAQFALVHDLVEADAGDTDTFGITPDARERKAEREAAALERLRGRLAATPWVCATIDAYEAQGAPEARFVRYLDKVLPRLTHALNRAIVQVEAGRTAAVLHTHHQRQLAELAHVYPEFAATVGELLAEASAAVEALLESDERAWESDPLTRLERALDAGIRKPSPPHTPPTSIRGLRFV